MKTEVLIEQLASTLQPVAPLRLGRSLALCCPPGVLGAGVLLALFYGLRPDWVQVLGAPMLWAKFVFAVLIACVAHVLVFRLAQPGRKAGALIWGFAAPIGVMAILSAIVLVGAERGEWAGLLMGETWRSCPFNILFLSLPPMLLMLAVLRRAAPTNPVLAGALVGVASGGLGSIIYSMHCSEMSALFIVVWYSAGILLAAALGAVFGKLWLRW